MEDDFEGGNVGGSEDDKPGMQVQVIEGGALEAITRAEIDMGVATAQRYPRNIQKFGVQLLALATMNVDVAEKMYYRLPRTESVQDPKTKKWEKVEKIIEGPSVRLAEGIQAYYGNIATASRVISMGQKSLTAQGGAHDLESNSRRVTEVVKSIVSKQGKRFPEHLVVTLANAAQQTAWRNAVLRVVPQVLYMPAYEAARNLVKNQSGAALVARWPAVVKYFGKKGLREDQLLALLGIEQPEQLTGDLYGELVGWKNGLDQDEMSVEELLARLGDKAPDTDAADVPTGAVSMSAMAQPDSVTTSGGSAGPAPAASAPPPVDVAGLSAEIESNLAATDTKPAGKKGAAPKPADAPMDLSPAKGASLFPKK